MDSNLKVIQGYGGGGKGGGGEQRTPTEATDSLRSKQLARIVDILCEGEIEGPANGLRSVFLDGVPLQNADGSYNFKDVLVTFRAGTQSQVHVSGFDYIESEVSVNTVVVQATPITHQITDTTVDSVRITLGFPALVSTDTSTGDVSGTAVSMSIDVDNNGGGFVNYVTNTISGKASSKYQRSYLIGLPDGGPWTIRVTRNTADSGSQFLQNSSSWDSYTEIKNIKLSYPNTALAAIAVNAEQFGAIPQRGYHMKGLKISIPDNYDPVTRTYTGTWSGTFTTAYSNNPAWVYYDILINSRYGVGEFLSASQIDKFALYSIGQYCDALVDDGFGGQEPRFTCNLYLGNRDEAINVVSSIASIFRGMVYWSNGTLLIEQDKPNDPIALFNETNVIGGQFTYSGSALRSRHTVALVTWNNPDNFYQQEIEYVPDNTSIALYGVRETEVIAVGCTSRGQAYRLGKYILATERLETETITFSTMLQGTSLYPGAIFRAQDQSRAGIRWGGRVVSSITSQITIDNPVTIAAGEVYTLSCVLPDGSIESRTLTNNAESATVLFASSPFSAAPQAGSLWVMNSTSLVDEKWRCVTISESDDLNYIVTGVKYDPNKYDDAEDGIIFDTAFTSLITSAISAPTNLQITESFYLINPALVGNRVFLSWTPPASSGIRNYRVTYRSENNNPISITTSNSSAQIDGVIEGTWEFTVTAFNALGTASPEASLITQVVGQTAPPVSPQNPTISSIAGVAIIRWNKSIELDVLVGGRIEIRHSKDGISPSWSESTSIGESLNGYETVSNLPLLPGSYLIKFIDMGGRYSVDPAIVFTAGATAIQFANLDSIYEQTGFAGTHNNTIGIDSTLKLLAAENMDDWGLVDDITAWDAEGGIATSGTYNFSGGIDLGVVSRVRLQKQLTAQIVNVADLFDDRTDNIATWLDFDGISGNEANLKLFVRATDDDPAGSPTWGNWEVLDSAELENRAFEFYAQLTSNSPVHNIIVTELGVTIDEVV